jgi:hypothetical protein
MPKLRAKAKAGKKAPPKPTNRHRPDPDFGFVYRERLKLAGLDANEEEPRLRAFEATVNLYRSNRGCDLETAKLVVFAAINGRTRWAGAESRQTDVSRAAEGRRKPSAAAEQGRCGEFLYFEEQLKGEKTRLDYLRESNIPKTRDQKRLGLLSTKSAREYVSSVASMYRTGGDDDGRNERAAGRESRCRRRGGAD